MFKLRFLLGIAGADSSESRGVHRIANFMQLIMLMILCWLFIQHFFIVKGYITQSTALKISWGIWAFFLFETLTLTLICKRHGFYLATNWLNLVIIILAFPPLWEHGSYSGLLRILRMLAIFYKVLSFEKKTGKLLSTRNLSIIFSVFIITTTMAGVFIYYIDRAIKSPWQGIWWAFQTISTVGYGDVLPHTVWGRLFAIVFMLLGVGLLAILSASVAYVFLKSGITEKNGANNQALTNQIKALEKVVTKLQEKVDNNK